MKKVVWSLYVVFVMSVMASAQESATPAFHFSVKTELAVPYKLYGLTVFEGSSRILYVDANYGNVFSGFWGAQPNSSFDISEMNYYIGYSWSLWPEKIWQTELSIAGFYTHYDKWWEDFFEFAVDASWPNLLPWDIVPKLGTHRFETFSENFARGWFMPIGLEREFALPDWLMFQSDQTITAHSDVLWSEGIFDTESGFHNATFSAETSYQLWQNVNLNLGGGYELYLHEHEDEWFGKISISYEF